MSKVATTQNDIAAAIDVPLPSALAAALTAPRIVIEKISPNVDGGRFAAKAIVDQAVRVTADIFMDGHDQLAAQVLWQAEGERERSEERRVGKECGSTCRSRCSPNH